MTSRLVKAATTRLILWLMRRNPHPQRVVTHDDGTLLFHRYQPLWPDEFWSARAERMFNRLPWWRPFNILLHRWVGAHRQAMHDHPRWSVTICLRGSVVEHTPWRSRVLRPGSIVIRSHRYIHAFELPPGARGKTWTLFIVGRRRHQQNGFSVAPFGPPTGVKT